MTRQRTRRHYAALRKEIADQQAAFISRRKELADFFLPGRASLQKRKRLTTQELAILWHMSAGTLRNWRAQSPRMGPRFVRVGRSVRYRMSDVVAYERRRAAK